MHRRREEKKESEQAGTRIRISIHVAYIHKITWYIPDGIYIYMIYTGLIVDDKR